MQTLQILNELLEQGESRPVLFLFNAVVLPVDVEGKIVKPEDATNEHFASVVYDCKDDVFAILEFPNRIWHALSGYRKRHGRLNDLRMLLSRHEDGRFKITIGNTDESGFPFEREQGNKFRGVHKSLFNKYMEKLGYQVHDKE